MLIFRVKPYHNIRYQYKFTLTLQCNIHIVMQIMNSKAYYLNNFLHKTRGRSEKTSQPSRQHTDLSDTTKLNKIDQPRYVKTEGPVYYSTKTEQKGITRHTLGSAYRDILQLQKRQKEVLLRVITKTKMHTKKSRWSSTSGEDQIPVLIEKHPLREINSLQVQIMKPTNRYFKKLDNIRIAERLLLAQPSREMRKDSMNQFYHQQELYKMNISKMPKSSRRENKRSKSKMLHRKKWND